MIGERKGWAGTLAATGIVLCATSALGVVTQIDGRVLPQTNALQGYVDRSQAQGGEGEAGAIDAINDAAVFPEVFLIPQDSDGTYRTVEFFDTAEGAGYENTFGWYNVEDPSTLYGALTCDGDDSDVGHEPGDAVTVDFQAEFEAGRYLGGFIGFFLVSENGSPDGCGEPSDLGVDNDFVVYTEAQLNGDGNYVHYLIYESVTLEDTYYFGFEDLWRGGDNDFEDMLIRVSGLIQPCEPTPEICDGLDNNCDGLVDNDPVDAGGECTEIANNNPGVGICEAGTLECVSTGPESAELQCVGEVGPTTEICDGIDNDCDGELDADDDSLDDPRLGEECGQDPIGECSPGETECVLGVVTCVGATGPSQEFCDGADNDCDGVVDGKVSDVDDPTPCTEDDDCPTSAPFCLPSTLTDGSVCSQGPADAIGNCPIEDSTCPGVRRCIDAAIECVEGGEGTEEICDGADNNCNGLVDEGNPGGGAECGPPGFDGDPISLEMAHTGQCLPGVIRCRGAELVCVGGRGPTEEICDGLDNDCDGNADETAECPGNNLCVEGKCAEPCGSAEFPCPGGLTCIDGYCVPRHVAEGGSGPGSGGRTGGSGSGRGGSTPSRGGEGPNAEGGSATPTNTGNRPGQGPTEEDHHAWGLATGGGGLRCAFGRPAHPAAALALGLVALVWVGRRRRRNATADRRAG